MKLKSIRLLPAILLIIILTANNPVYAGERLQQHGDYVYYIGNGSSIRLCRSFGRSLERGWNIDETEGGFKRIQFTTSERGNFIYNYFLLRDNRLVFAFDKYSQVDFLRDCVTRFHKMVKKRNPKVKYTVDNYRRIAGVLRIQDPYVIKYCANFYREHPKKPEFIYMITTQAYNFKTDKKVKQKVRVGVTVDTSLDFVRSRIKTK